MARYTICFALGLLAAGLFACSDGSLFGPDETPPEIPPTPIYFGEGDAALDESGEDVIDVVAAALRGSRCAPLRIRGYSTPSGSREENAHLGWGRACWVVDSLALAGVDTGCFTVESVGENATPDIPVLHRRAVVVDIPE